MALCRTMLRRVRALEVAAGQRGDPASRFNVAVLQAVCRVPVAYELFVTACELPPGPELVAAMGGVAGLVNAARANGARL